MCPNFVQKLSKLSRTISVRIVPAQMISSLYFSRQWLEKGYILTMQHLESKYNDA